MITHILKLLSILVCLTCSAFADPAKNASQLQIQIKNAQGKGIPGLLVYTENMKNHQELTQTTDSSGWIVWDNCHSFFLTNNEKNAGVPRVKIHIEDPEHVYNSSVITMDPDWGADCKFALRLSIAQNKTYATPEQMRDLAVTRGLNLRYFPACKSDFNAYPAKVSHQCITKFKKTKVPPLEAEMLARIYLDQTYPNEQINIQCSTTYETRNGNDYLQCTSSDARKAFEFMFRDLNPRVVLQNEHASNIELNTVEALCDMRDGKYTYHSNTYPLCYKDDAEETEAMCMKLNSDAVNFGWSAEYKYWPVALATTCGFEFGVQDSQTFTPKTYGSIDPYVFQHIEVQSTQDLVLLLNQYVRFKTVDEFDGFWCDSAPTRITKSQNWSIHENWNYQNVLTCHLNTQDGQTHDIDFVFKSVNQSNQTKNDGDMAGMRCISSGGNFDGKNCSAIGKQQCQALNLQLPGGTVFDERLGLCLMRDSVAAETLRQKEHIATVAGAIVIGIAVTIGSSGTAGEVAIAWIATALSTASTIALEILNEIKNERARDFVAASQLCPYTTTCTANGCSTKCYPDSICAKNTLLNAYADIASMLIGSDSADQISDAVSYATETLVEKISADCINEDFKTALKQATNNLEISIRAVQEVNDLINLYWFFKPLKNPQTATSKFVSGIVVRLRNQANQAALAALFGGGESVQLTTNLAPYGSLSRAGQHLVNTLPDPSETQGTNPLQNAAAIVPQLNLLNTYIDKNIVHPENELPSYINDL